MQSTFREFLRVSSCYFVDRCLLRGGPIHEITRNTREYGMSVAQQKKPDRLQLRLSHKHSHSVVCSLFSRLGRCRSAIFGDLSTTDKSVKAIVLPKGNQARIPKDVDKFTRGRRVSQPLECRA